MTRKEAIKVLKEIEYPVNGDNKESRDMAFNMAIEALEQEPCEDAISRQGAIFLASNLKQDLPDDERIADMVMAHNEGISEYQTQLSLLPSVTSQPKIGKWIIHQYYNSDGIGFEYFSCSECNDQNGEKSRYCPNCGAKMKEGD